jgi:hypothetical protein
MHTLLRHIRINNDADLSRFAPLIVGGKNLGYLSPTVAEALNGCAALVKSDAGYRLAHDESFESRNTDLKIILAQLIERKIVSHERHELYAVAETFGATPLALADRALMPVLGLEASGIHCNGYVVINGEIKIWIGKRSTKILIEPGKLDHIVAGGQPHGLTLRENLLKESQEEAGIPEVLVNNAVEAGTIRYARADGTGVRRDTLFLFDMELPADFKPVNQDGEASGFELMSVENVRRLMEETDEFKFNVPLVLIDFYIRHNLIKPDEPGYAELAQAMKAAARI